MDNTIIIERREAVPLRALPFASHWLDARTVLNSLTHTNQDDCPLELTGHFWADGRVVSSVPREWDELVENLTILERRLQHTEAFPDANYPQWLIESRALLPANCFVWRDELEAAYGRIFLNNDPDGYDGPG